MKYKIAKSEEKEDYREKLKEIEQKYKSLGNETTDLHKACDEEEGKKVKKMIFKGAKLDLRDDKGRTALFISVENDSLEIISLLLNGGADANIPDNEGNTPLFFAVKYSKAATVKLLLEKGNADPNLIFTKYNKTALHAACERNQVEKIKLLVTKADPNIKDSLMYPPIYYSIKKKSYEMVKLLASKKADLNSQDKYGRSLLYICVMDGDFQMTSILLSNGADANIPEKDIGNTPLICEIRKDESDLNMVELLISKSDVSIENRYGQDAFYYANLKGKHNIAKILEKAPKRKRADRRMLLPSAQLKKHESEETQEFTEEELKQRELLFANKKENDSEESITSKKTLDLSENFEKRFEIVSKEMNKLDTIFTSLVDDHMREIETLSIDVKALVKNQESKEELSVKPLEKHISNIFDACEVDRPDLVEEFLKKGVNVNSIRKEDEKTCLHIACENNFPKTVKILLSKGAKTTITDLNGKTPFFNAVRKNNSGVAKLAFDRRCKDIDHSLIFACRNRNLQFAKFLIENGAEKNFRDNTKRICLHYSSELGDMRMVELLFDCKPNKKIEIDAQDIDGNTPLSVASGYEMVKFLVERNASVNTKNSKGKSVLSLLSYDTACARLLLDRGATATVMDFIDACFQQNIHFVEFLVKKGFDVNMKDKRNGVSILMKMVMLNKAWTIKCLLENGSDPNLTDNQGNECLGIACKNNREDQVEMLLCKGAKQKEKALVAIVNSEQPSLKIASLLLKYGTEPNAKCNGGLSVLHLACMKDNLQTDLIELLLSNQASVNTIGTAGNTPLHLVLKHEHLHKELVKLLLINNANTNTPNNRSQTPLYLLCSQSGLDVTLFHLFFSNNANPNARDENGTTCFMRVCQHKEIGLEVISLFLENNANPNLFDKEGRTALFFVCKQWPSISAIKMFLSYNTKNVAIAMESIEKVFKKVYTFSNFHLFLF